MSNVPFYDSNEGITVGGQTFPLWRWRQIAIAANQARQQNPNDTEAMEALEYATTAVRTYANTLRQRPTLSQQDTREAQPGPVAAAGMGAANAMSLGFGDEGAGFVAGLSRLVPGGESPVQAYLRARDANRAFDAAAAAHNPAQYVGGQVLGTLLSAGAGGLTTAAGPLTRTIAAGAVPGATAGARALAMGAGGTVGAGIGGVAAYGSGEEGPIADIANVPTGMGLGFLFGAGGTGFANRSIRNERLRVADEQVRAMAPQATQARIAADQELAGTRAAQRRIAESRAAEAEATRPMRIQQAENQLALSTSRRNMLPTTEQAARDRAAMTGQRAEVLPEQLEVRGQQAGLRLDEAQRTQGLRLQMVEDRAAILAMRRARMEAGQAGATDPDAFIRASLSKQGFTPELIERTITLRRTGAMPPRAPAAATPSQAAAQTHSAPPVVAPPEPQPAASTSVVAPPTAPTGHRMSPAEAPPLVAGSSYPAPARDFVSEAAVARRTSPLASTPEEAAALPGSLRPDAPRGATQAQIAFRQGEVARRMLAGPPTERAEMSVKALFANMPQAERLTAIDAFVGNFAPQGVHAGWNDIFAMLRALP